MGISINIYKIVNMPDNLLLNIEIYFLDETGMVLDELNKPIYILSQ